MTGVTGSFRSHAARRRAPLPPEINQLRESALAADALSQAARHEGLAADLLLGREPAPQQNVPHDLCTLPHVFTVRQAAEHLQVCARTIYEMCARGELAHFRVSNAVRILEHSLLRLVTRPTHSPLADHHQAPTA